MRARELSGVDLGVLAVLMGATTTVVFYRFGIDNQLAELPVVLRAIDPGYLSHDFYTNASDGYGPRFGFARAVAALTDASGLPAHYFGWTLVCNVAIAWLTALVARELFGGRALAGACAAALVLSLSTFRLGYAPALYVDQLLASRAAVPPLLLALMFGLRGRAAAAAVSAGVAAWLHPTLGLEGGAVALAAAFAFGVGRLEGARALVLFAALGLAAAAPSLASPREDPSGYFAIETLFRHPHHNFLKFHPNLEFLRAGVFLGGSGAAALWWWRANASRPALRRAAGVLAAAPLVICAVGLPLVDALPGHTTAALRPLRLLLLTRWLGWLLCGGLVALAVERLARQESGPSRRAALGLLAGAAIWLGATSRPSAGAALCLALYAAAIAALALAPSPRAARSAAVVLGAALVLHAWLPDDWLPATWSERTARLRPALTLDARDDPVRGVAAWARAETPGDAVFLTPPELGAFRLFAQRAIVVDWKSFPFQEPGARAWYERIQRCYGPTEAVGWEAAHDLTARYAEADPVDRVAGGCHYGASYAVVPANAPVGEPALYRDRDFKVVRLREP